jgi:hypothetical protein
MVTKGCLLEAFLQGFRSSRGDVMLHGALNKAAALARPGQTVKGAYRGFLQDDVDAFCHGTKA